ncbi:MAG: efflux RND transporter periplasmic adaptor subunit [Thermoanaerobaculia bacterium]
MNRTKVLVTIGLITALVAIGAITILSTRSEQSETAEEAIYYCPMHPSVVSDKPGNCPICGMKLVLRKNTPDDPAANAAASSGSVPGDLSRVSLSPTQSVMANVRTIAVTRSPISRELVASGRVTYDETRLAQISSYTAGRIEQLYVNFTGEAVRKGAPVAAIYSPELFATQQEYLLALQNQERMKRAGFEDARTAAGDLVESTRRRLQLFGMSNAQINQVARTGKILYTTTITSSVSGVVTQKLVVPQQYVTQGQTLLQVADLSTVWVEADVPESDLAVIRIGQCVAISSPTYPGIDFPGSISFIQPVVAGETRTNKVRVELPNPALRLKPDMFVSVRIQSNIGTANLVVPASAVVDRGQRQFVWVEAGPGSYTPRQVRVGVRTADKVEIVSGLTEGEKVVVNGGFLLDSEAQLRAASAGAAAANQSTGQPAPAHSTH